MTSSIDQDLVRLCAEIGRRIDELSHVDADRILFVVGAARLDARASIRPLTFGGSPPERSSLSHTKPLIRIFDVEMLYEICLRPRFFLEASLTDRISIIVHELWHTSRSFDGTLDPGHRHSVDRSQCLSAPPRSRPDAGASSVKRMVDRLMESGVPEAARFLAMEGDHEMWAWLSRPPSRIPVGASIRALYDERDLFRARIPRRSR